MLGDEDEEAAEDGVLQVVVELLDDQEVADQLSSWKKRPNESVPARPAPPNERGGAEDEASTAEPCWGAQASGISTHCTRNFVPDKNHFQNKFCPECRRKGIHVPADLIRVVHDDDGGRFKNSKRAGFWSEDASSSALQFRRVNQARLCKGNELLITNIPFTPSVPYLSPVPDSSLIDPTTRTVHLVVSCGTLVPRSPALSGPLIVHSRKRTAPHDAQEMEGAVHGRPWSEVYDERCPVLHTSSVDAEFQSSFITRSSESDGGSGGEECPANASMVDGNLHDFRSIMRTALGNPDLDTNRECPASPHEWFPQMPHSTRSWPCLRPPGGDSALDCAHVRTPDVLLSPCFACLRFASCAQSEWRSSKCCHSTGSRSPYGSRSSSRARRRGLTLRRSLEYLSRRRSRWCYRWRTLMFTRY